MNKKILVTKSSIPDLDEYVEEIKELWDTQWITNMGVKHQKLEKLLLEYLDTENTTLFTRWSNSYPFCFCINYACYS